jgi:hypothetical protein
MTQYLVMDCVFDLRKKNWPTQDDAQVDADHIQVTMCENGYKAVTQGTPGVGKAVLAGISYCVQLPATIIDAQEWVVSFTRVDSAACKEA